MNRTLRKRIQIKRKNEARAQKEEAYQRINYQKHLEGTKTLDVFNETLRKERKLGVAHSMNILMTNINEMVEHTDKYFLKFKLDDVLEDPGLAGIYGFFGSHKTYDLAYLPEIFKGQTKPERVSVKVGVITTIDDAIDRASRNLAYKILKREGTHGVEYKRLIGDDYVEMSAVPVILTVE